MRLGCRLFRDGTYHPASLSASLDLKVTERYAAPRLAAGTGARATCVARIAIPIGIILGRYGWRLFADQFGVVPDPAVPLYLMVALLPSALVLANLIAIIPGGAAARTKPALVLREE